MNDLEYLVRRSLVRYVDQEAADVADSAEARPRTRRTRPFGAAVVAAAVVLVGAVTVAAVHETGNSEGRPAARVARPSRVAVHRPTVGPMPSMADITLPNGEYDWSRIPDFIPLVDDNLNRVGYVSTRRVLSHDPAVLHTPMTVYARNLRTIVGFDYANRTPGFVPACSSGISHGLGTMAVQLRAVGGPASAAPRALPGVVSLRSATRSCDFVLAQAKKTMIGIEPGTYEVTGHSPEYQGGNAECRADQAVTVRPGRLTTIIVVCAEK